MDQVLESLGARYRLGAPGASGLEILYRAGKTEFRPSRFFIGTGESGRELELTIDVRIPKDAPPAAVEALVGTFENKSAAPRGFARFDDSSVKMTSEKGDESGTVRTLRYRRDSKDPIETAKQIRAIVESIDIPMIIGIHEPEHVIAREAPPHRERVKKVVEDLENWEYQLDGGVFGSLTLVINPNDRTLRVVERKLLKKKELGEVLKLAHVAKFSLRKKEGRVALIAAKKDGTEIELVSGSGDDNFLATAGRMAKKVMIPIESAGR